MSLPYIFDSDMCARLAARRRIAVAVYLSLMIITLVGGLMGWDGLILLILAFGQYCAGIWYTASSGLWQSVWPHLSGRPGYNGHGCAPDERRWWHGPWDDEWRPLLLQLRREAHWRQLLLQLRRQVLIQVAGPHSYCAARWAWATHPRWQTCSRPS